MKMNEEEAFREGQFCSQEALDCKKYIFHVTEQHSTWLPITKMIYYNDEILEIYTYTPGDPQKKFNYSFGIQKEAVLHVPRPGNMEAKGPPAYDLLSSQGAVITG